MEPSIRGHYEHTWGRGCVFQPLTIFALIFSLVFKQILKLLETKETTIIHKIFKTTSGFHVK